MSRSRRHSHSRVARRRAKFRATAPALVPCPKCKTPRLPHRVCPLCGSYGGRQIVGPEKEKEPKRRRRSA